MPNKKCVYQLNKIFPKFLVSNFIHLFVDEDTVDDPDAPKTPFCTAVGVISGRFVAPRPRLMWIRAKGLEPTHLSFK